MLWECKWELTIPGWSVTGNTKFEKAKPLKLARMNEMEGGGGS